MKTYHDLQSEKTPVEWNGLACVMLGTKDGNGLFHRMDGCPVSLKGDGEPQPRPADPKRLEMFALTGKWIFHKGEEGYSLNHADTCPRLAEGARTVPARHIKNQYKTSEPEIWHAVFGHMRRTGVCAECGAAIYRDKKTGDLFHASKNSLIFLAYGTPEPAR